jgi:hypothetical protein
MKLLKRMKKNLTMLKKKPKKTKEAAERARLIGTFVEV